MGKMTVRVRTPGKTIPNQYVTIGFFDTAAATDIRAKICKAGAKVLLEKLKAYLEETTHDANAAIRGTLAKSLTITENNGRVFVGPKGKHHGKGAGPKTRAAGYHRPKTGQGTSHKRKHHGMAGAVSATDVGYYLEFGTPRMKAEHWMETALEQSEEEIIAVMENEWDEYLKSLGL